MAYWTGTAAVTGVPTASSEAAPSSFTGIIKRLYGGLVCILLDEAFHETVNDPQEVAGVVNAGVKAYVGRHTSSCANQEASIIQLLRIKNPRIAKYVGITMLGINGRESKSGEMTGFTRFAAANLKRRR
jgi:hypothetical protein